MTRKNSFNTKLLSIQLGLGLVTLAVITILPTITFAGSDYSNVMVGSKPVYEWIADMEQEKATPLIPVSYVNPSIESNDAVYFGSLTVDQVIDQIVAASSDTDEWVSHITKLSGGEWVDKGVPLQSVSEIETGITAQQVSAEK